MSSNFDVTDTDNFDYGSAYKPEKQVYVIGGESIYRQLLPYCKEAYVTKIDYAYQADRYFPDLDQMEDWELYEEGEEQTFFDIEYYFNKYRRRA